METVTLQTESFLFQGSGGQFRAIPFYELSIDEWVIFENGQPKYLLNFNRRTKPLVQDLSARLNNGEELEEAIQNLGRFLGRHWAIHPNIEGTQVANTQQKETVTVTFLDNLADLYVDVYFVATNAIDMSILLDEDRLIESFVADVNEIRFEAAYAQNEDDLMRLLALIFNRAITLTKLASNNDREVYDLTNLKDFCITVDELDQKYKQWIDQNKRNNSMTEYGIIMSVVAYIRNNIRKRHLVIVTEKRKHW